MFQEGTWGVLRGWGARTGIVTGSFICQKLAVGCSSLVTDVILVAIDVVKTIPLKIFTTLCTEM